MLENEAEIVADATTEHAWALVERFAGTPRWKPEDVNSAVDELVARLAALGVTAEVHAPEVFLSVPIDASVTLGGATFRAKPPSNSLSVPGGVEAELAHLPANTANLRSYAKDLRVLFGESVGGAEEARAMIEGKILVTQGFGNPALTAFAEEWGAVGLIAVNPGVDIHWGTCTTIWGSPDLDDLPRKPSIPVVAVNNPDGEALIAAAREGARATIRTELQEGWFAQKIPIVTIPGAVEPDRFVLVHGHLDSWDVGVGDNATGDALLLELARVLTAHKDKLRRSVRIAWWPGHSTGRYAGSTWFADAFARDLDEECVAQINCDSPGCRWATSYHQTTAHAETRTMVAEVIEGVAGQAPVFKRPNQAGDYSFDNIGITSHFMLSSTMPDDLRAEKGYYAVSGCGGNIAWHTENDTLEIADRNILGTDLEIYLRTVLRHACAERLPADWRLTALEFSETVARYAEAAAGRFDLSPAIEATERLTSALDAFYAADAAGTIPARAANDVKMRLARILVPINFTTEARFRHDPAYTRPPLPTLATALELTDHEAAGRLNVARTQLMRGMNRYLAALREAERLIGSAS
jgi:hypothetical protein